MQLTNTPGKLVLPFANDGAKNTIPTASQIGITAGAASLTDGFPPLTRTPIAAGGVPPSGLDMNGVLYALSAALRWANAGGGYAFDDTFAADSNVGGYPKGARIMRSDGEGYWLNTAENNTTDPESGGAGWVPDYTSGAAAVAMASANVTLTSLQAGRPIITITGTLTANLNLIFPTYVKSWIVVNNATGAYSVTCKTSAGTGVAVGTGTQATIAGDGTNVVGVSTVVTAASDPTFADSSVKAASTGWIRGAMAAIATAAGFVFSASANGYIKFPTWLGGLIIQWGTALVTTGTVATNLVITLPIAFPSAGLFGIANGSDVANSGVSAPARSQYVSTTTITITHSATASFTQSIKWFALGH